MKGTRPSTTTKYDSFLHVSLETRLKSAIVVCSCSVFPLGDASVSCYRFGSETFGRTGKAVTDLLFEKKHCQGW